MSKTRSIQRQICQMSTKSSKMCSNRRQIGKLSTKSSKMCSNQSQICQIRVMVQKTVGGNKQKMNSLFPELFIFCLVADGFAYGRLRCHVDDYSFILFSLFKCRYHLTKACLHGHDCMSSGKIPQKALLCSPPVKFFAGKEQA